MGTDDTNSNYNIWSISLRSKDAQAADGILITDDFLERLWSVLFDPKCKIIHFIERKNLIWK